jgi:hypothetical protein
MCHNGRGDESQPDGLRHRRGTEAGVEALGPSRDQLAPLRTLCQWLLTDSRAGAPQGTGSRRARGAVPCRHSSSITRAVVTSRSCSRNQPVTTDLPGAMRLQCLGQALPDRSCAPSHPRAGFRAEHASTPRACVGVDFKATSTECSGQKTPECGDDHARARQCGKPRHGCVPGWDRRLRLLPAERAERRGQGEQHCR